MNRVPLASPGDPDSYPCHEARTAWMDTMEMVYDVFNLPDAPANRELLTLANKLYLQASNDLMEAWDRLEDSPS